MRRILPILFSGPMIVAMLQGRKNMTRRLAWRMDCGNRVEWWATIWQKVKPGDLLWVRERTLCVAARDGEIKVRYEADDHEPDTWLPLPDRLKIRPKPGERLSMGCYREASRLTGDVTGNRLERLQKISRADAIAEGLRLASQEIEQFFRWPAPYDEHLWLSPVAAYKFLWEELHGYEAWDANPEVCAISYGVIHSNVAAVPQ